MLNQQKVNNANSLFGTSNNVNIGGGISGDMLQQWAMLGANTAAYKKLQALEKNGGVRESTSTPILNSDRYFNDNFDAETGKIKTATYKPISTSTPELDEEATSGDLLDDMRRLALAASSNPDSLNQSHYDLFEKMRQTIASNFVTGKSTSSEEVETSEAQAGKVTSENNYRYLEDAQQFTIAGGKGEKAYNFGIGTSIEDIAAAIAADSAATGVTAEAVKNEDGTVTLNLSSTDTGKDAFVRVDQTTGDLFAAAGSSASGKGQAATTGTAEEVASGDDTQAAMAAGMFKGKTYEDVTFVLQGAKGQQRFSFEAGATAQEIASAINNATDKTGIKAEVIFNADTGEAEGLGLLADKAGTGNYVQATMEKGSLFTTEGRTVSVAGSSKSSDSSGSSPAIGSLKDLGQVTVGDEVYSFADLVPGGKASLAKNPDAALAVLNQAIKEIYNGLAEIKGFDPKDTYIAGVTNTSGGASASNNTVEFDNYGSDAMTNWINRYVRDSN